MHEFNFNFYFDESRFLNYLDYVCFVKNTKHKYCTEYFIGIIVLLLSDMFAKS